MRELDFQKWLTEHNPKDEMLWKESYWKAYVFWRDKILPMFSDEFYKEHYKMGILYCLLTHAFNYQIVFNSKGEYNMPSGAGRSYFSPQLEEKLKKYIEVKNKTDILLNKTKGKISCHIYQNLYD